MHMELVQRGKRASGKRIGEPLVLLNGGCGWFQRIGMVVYEKYYGFGKKLMVIKLMEEGAFAAV